MAVQCCLVPQHSWFLGYQVCCNHYFHFLPISSYVNKISWQNLWVLPYRSLFLFLTSACNANVKSVKPLFHHMFWIHVWNHTDSRSPTASPGTLSLKAPSTRTTNQHGKSKAFSSSMRWKNNLLFLILNSESRLRIMFFLEYYFLICCLASNPWKFLGLSEKKLFWNSQ